MKKERECKSHHFIDASILFRLLANLEKEEREHGKEYFIHTLMDNWNQLSQRLEGAQDWQYGGE